MVPLPTFTLELELWQKGFEVLGIDEVGRGAFAGPLVLGGVIFPKNTTFPEESILCEINDSKILTSAKRKEIAKAIYDIALFAATTVIPVSIINKYGIGKATYIGARKICNQAGKISNCHMLMDGFHIPYIKGFHKKQTVIIRGDSISRSIAAASIIAKVHRDTLMEKLHSKFKEYNFLENKGYGTKFHREMIKQHGLSKIHRTSFSLDKFLN
jgi:ribonuclease HII